MSQISTQLSPQASLDTQPLSMLERLPLEIVEKIFIESCNCNLPLTSPHLQYLLSNPKLKRQIATHMLLTNHPTIQAGLFRRRFLNLALYGSIVQELSFHCMFRPYGHFCPHDDWPHFLLSPSTRLSARCLRKLGARSRRDDRWMLDKISTHTSSRIESKRITVVVSGGSMGVDLNIARDSLVWTVGRIKSNY
ncbi:MAG: hypothetical protein M1829_004789 [Trizodia sp. TS-e1964]|nr:MAG: hypothetical protein M1829_004789 [Trizodia sp. TS-e1964]